MGDTRAQHSYALLLWNEFGGVTRDTKASARWHAAAAAQNHLDAMSVLGGCLRTGTGVQTNLVLGLRLIDFCASKHNPTGINKKAALLEADSDDRGAFRLYLECFEKHDPTRRANALLLFNLGWCFINGF
jgi:TPR repeat protein